MTILFLLGDLFCGYGGIQSYARTLVKAIELILNNKKTNVMLIVLNDAYEDKRSKFELKSEKIKYISCKGSKVKFVVCSIFYSLTSSMVVFGHINFSPLLFLMRFFNPFQKAILIVYGVEVTKKFFVLHKIALKFLYKIISISKNTMIKMSSLEKINERKFYILPCTLEPIFLERISNGKEKLQLPPGKIVLTVSRLEVADRYKNIDQIIQAMEGVLKEVPDTYCFIVGDGSDRERLESIVKAKKLQDKVLFVGKVENEILKEYYKLCNVFVLPSTKEGFGIVFLEAMYNAKPCIGVSSGGVTEVIDDSETGILCKPNHIDELTKSITYLLKNNETNKIMGENGKKKYEKEFSFVAFQKRLEKILFEKQQI